MYITMIKNHYPAIRDEEQFLLLCDVRAFVVKLAPSRYTLCWSALTLTEWHLRSL